MRTHVSNEPIDPYLQASAQAREAIDAARDTQESVRATRRRIRLNGLILSWRGRPTRESAVRSERLALILDAVRDEVDAPMGNIQLYENGALCIRTAWGLSDAFLAHFAKVLPGKCACGAAYRRLAPVIVDEIRTSPLFDSPDREMLLNSGIEACQSLALTREGRHLGVISLHYRESGIPRRRQAAFSGLAAEIAEAVSLATA